MDHLGSQAPHHTTGPRVGPQRLCAFFTLTSTCSPQVSQECGITARYVTNIEQHTQLWRDGSSYLYLCCTTNQRSILFGYLLHPLIEGHQGHVLCILESCVAEEVDGVGDKGSGNTAMVEMRTFLEAFLNIFLPSACFIDNFFFGTKQNSDLGTALVKCWIIGLSKL